MDSSLYIHVGEWKPFYMALTRLSLIPKTEFRSWWYGLASLTCRQGEDLDMPGHFGALTMVAVLSRSEKNQAERLKELKSEQSFSER